MGQEAQVQIVMRMVDKTSRQLDNISKSTKTLSKNMGSLGKSMTKNITLPLVAVGVAGVKMASDLDTALRNVQSITGQTDAEIKQLSQDMLDMSTSMDTGTFSAVEYTRAMYDVNSSGFEGAEAQQLLDSASRAATAGQAELSTAIDTTTSVIKAFNMAASDSTRINDLLFTGVRVGKQTYEQLGTGVAGLAPVFNAFNIPLEDSIAGLTLFSNKGVDAATAVTRYNAAILEINKPTAELSALIKAAGYETGRQMLATLGSVGALEELNRVSLEQNVILADTFSSRQASLGIMSLTGENMNELIAIQEELTASTGATDAAFAEQMKSFENQLKKFMAAVQEFLILIGNELMPILIEVMDGVRPIIEGFANLDDGTKKTIVTIGLLVAVGGPLLMFFASIIGAISTIAGAFSAATGAIAAAGTAATASSVGFGALSISISPILIPLAALAAALAGLVILGPKILDAIGGAFNGIKDAISDLFKGTIIGDLGKSIGKMFGYGAAEGMVEGTGEGIKAMAGMMNNLGSQVKNFAQGIGTTLHRAVEPAARTVAAMTGQPMPTGSTGFRLPTGGGPGGVAFTSLRRKSNPYGLKGADMSSLQADIISRIKAGAPLGGGGGGVLSSIPAAASAGSGGDVIINIKELNVPAGTPKEAVDFIWEEIGKRITQRGFIRQ